MKRRFCNQKLSNLPIGTALFLLVLTAAIVSAGELSLYLDNDSIYLKPNGNTDRHYTNGTKLVYITPVPVDWNWTNYFGGWCFGNQEEKPSSNFGAFFGQNIYGPDHDDKPEKRSPEDMKYAGWTYTGFFLQRSTQRRLEHTELNLGMTGPSSKGETVQNEFHEWIDSNRSIGWEDQLNDEMTADFTYAIRDKINLPGLACTDNYDTMAEYSFTAGSLHRHADLGFIFRYGIGLQNDFGPGRLELPVGEYSQKDTLYAFTRLGGRGVEYNRFLSGLEKEPFVGRLEYGLTWKHKSFRITYSQTLFTQEFEEQHGVDSIATLLLKIVF